MEGGHGGVVGADRAVGERDAGHCVARRIVRLGDRQG
jgi:hypothetical protein